MQMGINRRTIEEIADEDIKGQLRQNAIVVRELSQSISYGGMSLKTIPDLIKKIIREEMWKKRINDIEILEFDSFEEFVTTDVPEGLGATMEQITKLCNGDAEAERMIDSELKRGPGNPTGRNQHSEKTGTFNNVKDSSTLAPMGNSKRAGIRKLEKDRPDLLEEVEAGKMSIHNAMIQAGFRKKQITVTLEVDAIVKVIKRYLTDEQIEQLKELL